MSIIERSALSKNETHQTFATLCSSVWAQISVTVKMLPPYAMCWIPAARLPTRAGYALTETAATRGDSCCLIVAQPGEATVVVYYSGHGGGLKAPMNTFWCQISYQMVNVRGLIDDIAFAQPQSRCPKTTISKTRVSSGRWIKETKS